jgi:hypothetical protein
MIGMKQNNHIEDEREVTEMSKFYKCGKRSKSTDTYNSRVYCLEEVCLCVVYVQTKHHMGIPLASTAAEGLRAQQCQLGQTAE